APKENKGSDPTQERKRDGPGMKKWRGSLKTEEFVKTYAQRCSQWNYLMHVSKTKVCHDLALEA
ncbi:MAG: hypothetical protein ACI8RA_002222, partial [Chlamydiales bacterium]